MEQNGSAIGAGSIISTQVCIIGSGPAAITLAWYLLGQGIDVAIVEAGLLTGGNGTNRNSILYTGTSSGQFTQNEPGFLSLPTSPYNANPPWERECVYGGTSTHWGQTCRPLDPGVFAGREGFPAWPFTREDLDPAYAEACRFLSLQGSYYEDPSRREGAGYNFTAAYCVSTNPQNYEELHLDGFEQAIYQQTTVKGFQNRTVDGKTIGQTAANVIYNASLVGINCANGTVQSVDVQALADGNLPGNSFKVSADVYVLACGAVENARQLLLAGLGGPDCGGYLMGHPIKTGSVKGITVNFGKISPQQQSLLSVSNIFSCRFQPYTDLAQDLCRGRFSGKYYPTTDNYYFELPPSPDTGITLDTITDVFGRAKARANWTLTDVSERSYDWNADLLRDSLSSISGSSVVVQAWKTVRPSLVFNGHHMGTTRMENPASKGVVDKDLRLHELDNLYVAGSSVFPSAGLENPTLTITALSIRLAQHLGERFGTSLGDGLGDGLLKDSTV
jgi:choline dehydrogenase-like flavoprotein